ncbi:IS110 family transposase, partial [uncultured Roseibium sp.]|uniref:IS110 family transposase n=1 Tax=uncultured Roseibium sp. TaxID=1936171 RepID=UPI00262052A5
PCLIGMEACVTSHYWAREIAALGHEVRLIPPAYVKPYVKRQKNDMADAEAICEAVTRPNMHLVAIKSADQQAVLMLHRARDLLVRQRTMLVNALRAHLAEFGIVAARGPQQVRCLVTDLENATDGLPEVGQATLLCLVRQLDAQEAEIARLDREIKAWHGQCETSQRLATIPGIGVLTATALAAT